MKRFPFYAGLFVTCATVTALQIIQTRILSVTAFYYLAFLSISMAMFGTTAGAVWVYKHPNRFTRDRLPHDLTTFSFRLSVGAAVCLLIQMSQALVQVASVMMVVLWAELALVLAVPFFFSGVVVSLALTRSEFPVGQVYAADLLGAAFGCLGALALLDFCDGPSAVLMVAALAAGAALLFAHAVPPSERRDGISDRNAIVGGSLMLAAAFLTAQTVHGLQPVVVKGQIDPRQNVAYERWNSYSRIHVGEAVLSAPNLWSASDRMPSTLRVWQRPLDIDGLAATYMFAFDGTPSSASFLQYDVTNVAYSLRNTGRAAIIGVGGGRDVLSAWYFGFRDITGVELNPIFIDLLTRRQPFADFAGLRRLGGIRFHVDEARSWFARTKERFDLIQMSMVDTWAATGAGAFSLSENGLYTIQGWDRFIAALTPTGVFTVSRWYGRNAINETGRMVSLGARALTDFGVSEPKNHLAVVANGNLATLILSRQPLTAAELSRLHRRADEMGFQVVLAPETPAATPLLGEIAAARSPAQLATVTADLAVDLTPPDDGRPFFFNQVPLTRVLDLQPYRDRDGVVAGNITASITLLLILVIATVLAALVIIVPLHSALRDTKPRLVTSGTAYFLLLGLSFMFVEMALLQRFSLFLGHPAYALSVVLFAIILSTGFGSLLSEKLALKTKGTFALWAAALAGYLACLPGWLPGILASWESAGIVLRGALVVGVIAPAGLLMGFGFPTGMRMVLRQDPGPAPWFWGINGAAGVLGSILAVAVAITFGIDSELLLGAAGYAALVLASLALWPRRRTILIAAAPKAFISSE